MQMVVIVNQIESVVGLPRQLRLIFILSQQRIICLLPALLL